MEQYNIDRVYVSGLSGSTPTSQEVTEVNREVASFVREEPEKIGGYVYISPEHDNATDVLKRGIEEQGLSGAKFWISSLCDDVCVNPVAEKIIDYGVPLLIHAFHKSNGQYPNESVGYNVAVLARRYPELKIIMAHMGGNCYNGIPAIRDCPNVWVDYSDSLFRGDELTYAIEVIGADRILHGSDMPPGSYLVNLGQVLEANMSKENRDKILYKNALQVFNRSLKLKAGCIGSW